MNFCSVAYTFYEFDYRVKRYAEMLNKPGNSVHVLALRRKEQKKSSYADGIRIYGIQKQPRFEKKKIDYLIGIIWFFIAGSYLLLKNYIKYQYKIIHIHNVPDFLIFMALIPKFLGAKIILDIHDILPEFYCQKFGKEMKSLLAKILLLIEKIAVHFADHIITGNELWREKIIRRDKIQPYDCTALLNYPNMGFFRKKNSKERRDDKFKIIYPGTISHIHGLDIAIEAIAEIQKVVPNIEMDIYSRRNNDSYCRLLEEIIREKDLDDRIRFHDAVRPEDLGGVYYDSDLGIVPKRNGIFSSEAFSTKIFDFMAAGLPIVASKTKIDEYYFSDSQIMFFQAENSVSLSDAIISLYRNPEKRKALSENGRKYVEINNWGSHKKIYEDIVDKLLMGRNR